MDRELPKHNFVFEVDTEKMEGRFLMDTGFSLQDEAEKFMLENCTYDHVARGYDAAGSMAELGESAKIGDTPIEGLGFVMDGVVVPAGDSWATQLVTDNGFICQVSPCSWESVIKDGGQMYLCMEDYSSMPLTLVNTPWDV